MCHYQNVKPAEKLINLTDKTIHVYDKKSGDIVTLMPEVRVLPEKPFMDKKYDTYYILDKNSVKQLKKTGRSTADLAFIDYESLGRDNIMINYLRWGTSKHYEVWLCRAEQNL